MAGDRDVKGKRGRSSKRSPLSTAPHRASKSASKKGPSSNHKPSSHPTSPPPTRRVWSLFGLGVGGSSPRSEHRHRTAHEREPQRRHDAAVRDRPHRIDIELKDLDHRRGMCLTSARLGSVAAKLEAALRRHQQDRERSLPPNATVRLYSEGRELGPDEVTDKCVTVWYRVQLRPDDGKFKFTHHLDDTNGRLESDMTDGLGRAIDQGATVGELRTQIAEYMRLEDANRIVIFARNGMRPGPVQGNSWEVRQLRNWLCSWLSIDTAPEREYVVARGLRREYLLHVGERECRRNGAGLVRKSISHLLKDVVHHGRSKITLSSSAITLIHNSQPAERNQQVILGGTYDFELPHEAADVFNEEESWLLPLAETCSVCIDDKKISEMPLRLSNACKHAPTTCKDCTAQWIQASLDTSTWDHLKCPECPELMKFDDIRRYATPEVFARYDRLATAAVLKEMRNFRWCLSTKCESGQIHDPSCAKFQCVACKACHCVVHNVPWHKGETCDTYDRRNRQKRKDEKASEATVKKMSKACPGCKVATYKYDGCNHITCTRCKHEWCYICFAPYQRNQHSFLFCAHNNGCTEHDPFIDLIAPEFVARRRGPGQRPPWLFPFPPPPHHPHHPPPPRVPQPPRGPNHGGLGGPRFPPPPDGFHNEFPPPPPRPFFGNARGAGGAPPPQGPPGDFLQRFLGDFEQRMRFGDEEGGQAPPGAGAMFFDTMGEFLTAVEGARGGRRPNGAIGALDEFGVLHR